MSNCLSFLITPLPGYCPEPTTRSCMFQGLCAWSATRRVGTIPAEGMDALRQLVRCKLSNPRLTYTVEIAYASTEDRPSILTGVELRRNNGLRSVVTLDGREARGSRS
jgi:hypothetical protein